MAEKPSSPTNSSTASEITRSLKRWAREEGFELAGAAPAVLGLGLERLRRWLDLGRHGEMEYMARSAEARADPGAVLPGTKSLFMVGLVYRTTPPADNAPPGEGRVSRYAWGQDYHHVVRQRLRAVGDRLRSTFPDVYSRVAVDSAPVMERDYAVLAGLGWLGKNTLVLSRDLGSWFFLGALLIDAVIEYDIPTESDHCGSCRRCLDACPTQAFDGPYQLDARRCISYLTIEHQSAIPVELRSQIGDWLYGCDICQEVCPWNEKAQRSGPVGPDDFLPATRGERVDLGELLAMDEEAFRGRFTQSALKRIGRDRIVRNAIIVAVNQRAYRLRGAIEALRADPSPIVRETAEWGTSRLLLSNDT